MLHAYVETWIRGNSISVIKLYLIYIKFSTWWKMLIIFLLCAVTLWHVNVPEVHPEPTTEI